MQVKKSLRSVHLHNLSDTLKSTGWRIEAGFFWNFQISFMSENEILKCARYLFYICIFTLIP